MLLTCIYIDIKVPCKSCSCIPAYFEICDLIYLSVRSEQHFAGFATAATREHFWGGCNEIIFAVAALPRITIE
jgi:hypothetical protein